MTESGDRGEGTSTAQAVPGEQVSKFKRVTRKRVTVSIHPETDRMLVQVCLDTASSRGVVLDRIVAALYNARATGVRHCVHGPICVHNLPYKVTVL